MGMYDDILAKQRTDAATAAAMLPQGSGTVYGATMGAERMKQGARQMFGIEEPAVIAAKAAETKQAKLNSILQKYSNASTRADFTSAFSELMGSGFTEEAAKVQEHLKNMPKPKDTPDNIQLFEYYKNNGGTDDFRTFLQSIKGKGVTINTGDTSTPGWEAIDKAYAEDYLNWNTNSGDMIGQVAQLKTVLTALESGENLTGAGIGLMPDWYNYLANPESMANKERVAEVVQRNLKLILGGQFSEREGKQLIDRAYNPALSEQENISRVKRLILQMEEGIKARQAMMEYFEVNGTFQGYKGVRPSVQSFYNAMEGIQPGEIRGKYEFIGGDPADKGSWKLREAQ